MHVSPLQDSVWSAVDSSGDGVVRFDEFVQFMSARVRDSESKAQVADSFKILSKDKVNASACTHLCLLMLPNDLFLVLVLWPGLVLSSTFLCMNHGFLPSMQVDILL